jgi:hypothetical protein
MANLEEYPDHEAKGEKRSVGSNGVLRHVS